MNKLLTMTVALVSMAVLSACQNFSTPQGVAGTAGNALKKNDAKTFFASLTDQAAAQYGSESGFAALKAELSHYSKIDLSGATLLDTSPDGDTRDYRVDVYGHNQRAMPDLIWRLNIACVTTHSLQDGAPVNCYGPNGNPLPGCQQGPTLQASTQCLISKLTPEI
jgi:hypothetical protein